MSRRRMVPAPSLHLIRDAHGATPFAAAGIGVTTAPPPSVHNMAQQPLDSQHREPSKHPPPQETQVEDRRRRRQDHDPLAPRQPGGGGVSQEAAGTSNGGAGDWLRLGLAPASSSSPGAVGSQPPLDLFPDRPGRPPLVSPPVFIRPALPGIPQASRTLPAPRAGPPWMPPWSPAGSAFPAAPPPPMLPFAHRTFYTPGAGASGVDTIRVVLPPPTVAGAWFALQAAPHQGREPFLPQIPRSFLRIKDVRVTVRLLIKYLVCKLGLEDESEVEITCRGRRLLPLLTLQHVRDSIWCQGEAVAPDMAAANHLMVLQYGRRP